MSDIDPSKIKDIFFPTEDFPLHGELLEVFIDIDNTEQFKYNSNDIFFDQVKQKLAIQLANRMIASKYISFMKKDNPMRFQQRFIARIFVTPDDQTRIIRKIMSEKYKY